MKPLGIFFPALIVSTSALAFPILSSSPSSSALPDKFENVEVVVNVKKQNGEDDGSAITLKISIPNDSTSKPKAEYKKNDNTFESIEKDETNKEKYQNLSKLASQFLRVQHKLNLIKTERWKNEKNSFETQCKNCCTQAAAGGSQSCSFCVCCDKDCKGKADDCCCKTAGSTDCKWEVKKDTMTNFAFYIKNINTSFTKTYLSPVKAYMTVHLKENSKYDEGVFWGSLVYGFVTYRYLKTNAPTVDKDLFKKIMGEDAKEDNGSNDKYFANVPQRFSYNFKNGSSEDKNIEKIVEKLNQKQDVLKLMKSEENQSDSSLCGCCDNTKTTDQTKTIDCLLKRNYVVGIQEETNIKTSIEDKIKNLKKDCCSTTV